MKTPKINILSYADNINTHLHSNANKVLTMIEKTQYKDIFSKSKIYIESFCNKFIPKIFRKTQKIEFFPGTNTINTRHILDYKKRIIRFEQFDINSQLIYLETYNPLTKKGVVREIRNGICTEQIFKGNVRTQYRKYNSEGKLIYNETFNPKQKKK